MRHLRRMHPYLYEVAMEAKEEFFVERFLAVVVMRQMVLVKVKWLGWNLEDSTWEPVRHFKDAPHFVFDFFVNEGLDVPPFILGALHGI